MWIIKRRKGKLRTTRVGRREDIGWKSLKERFTDSYYFVISTLLLKINLLHSWLLLERLDQQLSYNCSQRSTIILSTGCRRARLLSSCGARVARLKFEILLSKAMYISCLSSSPNRSMTTRISAPLIFIISVLESLGCATRRIWRWLVLLPSLIRSGIDARIGTNI